MSLRKAGLVSLACFQNITMGGLLFGWASISSSLLVAPISHGGMALDPEDIRTIFIVASSINFLGPLVTGLVLDLYGPRICSVVSTMFVDMCIYLLLFDDITLCYCYYYCICFFCVYMLFITP